MRIAFATFGCKINQYETDGIRRSLAEQGGEIVPFDEDADIYVINTCSVTAKSDYQCRQAIRAAVRRKSSARVIVTGCYAETHSDVVRHMPGVSAVVPNQEKMDVRHYLDPSNRGSHPLSALPVPVAPGRTRTYLKIQDGCDSRCSYCIVPLARGSSRSVPTAQVLSLFDEAVNRSAPEVVLSGIHIGRYGADLSPVTSLSSLLQDLSERRGGTRIRLSSIEPNEITPEVIGLLGNGLCRHLHIPLQSGDDGILKAMNRKYHAGYFAELLHRIESAVPDSAIGTDVMVGFPGEGDKEFQRTCDMVENLPITHLHVFSYSPRPGTPASAFPSQVPEQVKKDRNAELRRLGREKNLHFAKRFLQRTLPVVVESKFDAASSTYSGLSDNYLRLAVSGTKEEHVGKLCNVRITDAVDGGISGIVCAN